MQQKEKKDNTSAHDVDEFNRDEKEKTPPGSFSGTNIDRYVAGETANPPEEIEEQNKKAPKEKE